MSPVPVLLLPLLTCLTALGSPISNGKGTTLFLSEYIKEGKLKEGLEAARVKPLLGDVESYSGMLTVAPHSHLFFWFFPARQDSASKPLLLWLNGLSTPSTYGLFLMNGPYTYTNGTLGLRGDLSWTNYYNVLYIDNPVGIGYSFTTDPDGYSKTDKEVGVNLLTALRQFRQVFSQFANNDFYLCSLSYGGHYVANLAKQILKNGKDIPLKGIFLGNPALDLVAMSNFDTYLYGLGLLDKMQASGFKERQDVIKKLASEKLYLEAFEKFILLFPGLGTGETYYDKTVGPVSPYGYMHDIEPEVYREFLYKKEVQEALHTGGNMSDGNFASMMLYPGNAMVSQTPIYEQLVQHYKLLIYVGQTDIIVNFPAVDEVMSSMRWPGAEGFRSASRSKLFVNETLSGYVKNYSNLTQALIRFAGHEAIFDQPAPALALLKSFTGHE